MCLAFFTFCPPTSLFSSQVTSQTDLDVEMKITICRLHRLMQLQGFISGGGVSKVLGIRDAPHNAGAGRGDSKGNGTSSEAALSAASARQA